MSSIENESNTAIHKIGEEEIQAKEMDNTVTSPSASDNKGEEKPLSKNQLKKRRRYEKLMAIKKRKKEQDKEAKVAKAKAEGRDLDKERRIQEERFLSGEGRRKRERKWEQRLKPAESSFKVCIDCSFENSMTKKEIGSLSSQIRYCYAINKKSYFPVYLSVSSLSGTTHENLTKCEGFPDNWRARAFDCSEKPLVEMHTKKDNLVYLTSDSDNVLQELDNSKVYVIGGIVDRNRLKGATVNKAKELGIETAKLPIDDHLKLCATKVLTCNHVFEILLKFREHKEWKKALLDVLPARKDIKTTEEKEEVASSRNQPDLKTIDGEEKKLPSK
mmetsp:Transcript_1756/g.2529  ORF Transcript_1756/g.2529 Transcript_1756/m.2529 type:complete len:331 (-) Transcript_1756:27-1019(-)